MAIENRDLEVGTKLIARYKKEEYRAEVVAGEEGKVKYPDDRRKGVQEPFIRRNNHHQQGLQRLGVLEPRARQRPNRTAGAGKLGRGGLRRRGDSGADACCRVPPSAQPEGRRGGTGETLLRSLPEELHRAGGRNCQAVSRWAHTFARLESVPDIRRILEVAMLDILRLENSIARARTLAYLVMAAIKLLETGELEERLANLEHAIQGQRALPEPEFDRGPEEPRFSVEVDP